MATTTPRLGLRKPATTDLVTVGLDINANMDILDTTLKDGITNAFTGPANALLVQFTNANGSTAVAERLVSTATATGRGAYQLELRHNNYVSADGLFGMGPDGHFYTAWDFGAGPVTGHKFETSGNARFKGTDQFFGPGAFAGGAYFRLNVTGTTLLMSGEADTADVNLGLKFKGNGALYFYNGAGTALAWIANQAGSQFALTCYNWGIGATRTFEVGAVDSGGAGYRMVRVTN